MALTSAKQWIKVTANTGTLDYILHYDKGTNPWTAPLDSTDWDTTTTYTGGTTSIGATGWFSFTLTTTDIAAGTLNTRIHGASEGSQEVKTITFASQNNATAGDRPYIELICSSGVRLLASTGVGT